jgi:hypothetical protein
VVSGFHIDFRVVADRLVNHRLHAPDHAKGRDGANGAIFEHLHDAAFIGMQIAATEQAGQLPICTR